MNPLDLSGPDFLTFYVVTGGAAIIVAGVLRWMLRQPAEGPDTPPSLSPCEIAYLCGGKQLAVHAAFTRLVHDQCLKLDPLRKTITVKERLPSDAPPLEKAIYREVAEHGQPDLFRSARYECDAIQSQLEEKGLLVSSEQALSVRFWPLLVIGLVMALGLTKLVVGIVRDKPIAFLFALLILLGLSAVLFFGRHPFRSRRGDRLLAMLRQHHADLRGDAQEKPSVLAGSELALALGLFGVGILTHQSQAGLRQTIAPPSQSALGGSDGGGGDGGGGCGGGGCGGGCGGCGGG